ncbi:hypothetical protein J6590_017209 [Homalodisca vitripennis]|nr:hypothetical protein J6590_017209 [Homalodisca vitripennis]
MCRRKTNSPSIPLFISKIRLLTTGLQDYGNIQNSMVTRPSIVTGVPLGASLLLSESKLWRLELNFVETNQRGILQYTNVLRLLKYAIATQPDQYLSGMEFVLPSDSLVSLKENNICVISKLNPHQRPLYRGTVYLRSSADSVLVRRATLSELITICL